MTNDFIKDNPSIKLNEWTDEPIEIATMEPEFDRNGRVKGIKQGKRTTTERVHYSRLSEPHKVSCPDMGHDWHIPDKNDHIAHCRGCAKKQFIRAIFEKVVDGKILGRDTSLQIF